MKKIVGMIRPFDLTQNFYVYEDGNKIAAAAPKMNEVADTIFSFAQEHEVNQVDLIGPRQYNRGLKRKIEEAENCKYRNNRLEINVL